MRLVVPLENTPPDLAEFTLPEYHEDLDAVISILEDMCNAIALIDGARFEFQCCNPAPWNLDIPYDFDSLLDQLPDLVAWLNGTSSPPFILVFFELPTMPGLRISRCDEYLEIQCLMTTRVSRSNSPDPPTCDEPEQETIGLADFCSMMTDLRSEFLAAVETICPAVMEHPWLQEWIEATEVKLQP